MFFSISSASVACLREETPPAAEICWTARIKSPVPGEHQALSADFHHGDVCFGGQYLDFVGIQQVMHRFRCRAEAVFPRAEQGVRLLQGADCRQVLVRGNAQGCVADVIPGQEGAQIILAGFGGELRLAVHDEIRSQGRVRPGGRVPALHVGDGLLEKLAVQVKADSGNVAALLGAQQVARAAYFQVPHGYLEAGTQLRVLLDGGDALAGVSVVAADLGSMR